MKISVVLGLGFGDEGKGVTTNWLSKEGDLVVRFNGGHQAGHTVVVGENRHVFSNFGSGALKGAQTYWSKYCTIDPLAIIKEYNDLKKIGVNPILYIDPQCPIVTPFDIISNQIKEKKISTKNGSCGVGFGETIEREENYYKLHAIDLLYPSVFKAKLTNIFYYYLRKNINQGVEWNPDLIDPFIQNSNEILSFANIKIEKPNFKSFRHLIFEGAQGILLDMDFGFFPNVTRSNCTSKNAINIVLEEGLDRAFEIFEGIDIYYVTRCYQTRHGDGFMTNRNFPLNLKNNEKETNVNHPWQGNFRTGALDLDLINYAIQCDLQFSKLFQHNLVITCLDQIDDFYISEKGSKPFKTDIEDFTKKIPGKIKNIHLCGSDEGEFI